jgi:hypothetical protein
MLTRRTSFTFLLYSLDDEQTRRAAALMHALHEHAGRAWILLDAPLAGMPPRILGAPNATPEVET